MYASMEVFEVHLYPEKKKTKFPKNLLCDVFSQFNLEDPCTCKEEKCSRPGRKQWQTPVMVLRELAGEDTGEETLFSEC